MEMQFHTGYFYVKVFMSLYTVCPVPIIVWATHYYIFLKAVNLLLLIPQHNWKRKVKICYVSLKCNVSKLYKGHEWYGYVGYVEASVTTYSNNTIYENSNTKGRRMVMGKSPTN